jgi:uracil-DNA glycosylase
MRTIEQLVDAVRREALRAPFPVDEPVYTRSDRDPSAPVLFAGSVDATVCVVGRDLGKDEVAAGQPLIGAGGRKVRAGLFRWMHGEDPSASDRRLESILPRVLLTNLVPYKPLGNQAYPLAVRERFRPFLAELIVAQWRGGDRIITLGTEAFHWFAPYGADPVEFVRFCAGEDRYEAEIGCTVTTANAGSSRRITLLPLPHPSPLNQRWYKRFPDLLARRLSTIPTHTP